MSTTIEWTDETWNPVRGCSRVSKGCASLGPQGPRWTGKIRLVPEALDAPLHWKKPRRVFVNSMSDLFHEDVPHEFIYRVFRIMARCQQHTFRVLTKRPERMLDFCWRITHIEPGFNGHQFGTCCYWPNDPVQYPIAPQPLPNLWLGVSVEDQKAADERIPLLLHTPAAVRWISAEPLLGPVDIAPWIRATKKHHFGVDVEGMLRNRSFAGLQRNDGHPMSRQEAEIELSALQAKGVKYFPASSCDAFDPEYGRKGHPGPRLDWVVVGGESGPGARPCHIEWIRSIVRQCQAASVPCFVKQLGTYVVDRNDAGFEGDEETSWPMDTDVDDPSNEWNWQGAKIRVRLRARKGGDPDEWPADLRVREWPR